MTLVMVSLSNHFFLVKGVYPPLAAPKATRVRRDFITKDVIIEIVSYEKIYKQEP
jgi:hypothetical protein